MKKLLLSLCAISTIACADIKVDMKLMRISDGQMIMQDSMLIDESMICRMPDETNEPMQQCAPDCQNGFIMCRLKSVDTDTATFNVLVMEKNNSGKPITTCDAIIKMPWDKETSIEVPGKDGEPCMFSITASKI